VIILKYIPNILKDEGRIAKELPFTANKTLQDYLTETGFELNESRAIVMGAVAKDLTTTLKDGDEVILTPDVGGPAFAFLGNPAFWAAVWNIVQIGSIVLSLGYAIYSAFQKPRTPSFGTTGEGLDEGSPTYGWDGISNTQDVGVPIPICYGLHRIGGNRIIKL